MFNMTLEFVLFLTFGKEFCFVVYEILLFV